MKTSAGRMWISCRDLKKKRQKYSNIFLFIRNYLKIIICGNRLGVWRLVHLVAGFEKKNQTLFIKTHNLFAHTRVTELVLLNILSSSQLDLEIDQILSLFWDGICLSNIIIIIFLFFTIVIIEKTIIIIIIIIIMNTNCLQSVTIRGVCLLVEFGKDKQKRGTAHASNSTYFSSSFPSPFSSSSSYFQ